MKSAEAIGGWRDPSQPTGSPWSVLLCLASNEFHARYRAQALGVAWSIVNPLVQMALISTIVGRLLHGRVEHIQVFVLIGIIVWQWVLNGLNAATSSFVQHAEMVRRAPFARPLLPMGVLLSYAINLGMDLSLLTLLSALWPSAFRFSLALLAVPVLLALLFVALAGIALATSALNIIYRDVAYAVSTALSLLYWATPIVYPLEVVPEPYRSLLRLNPLTNLIGALRNAIMNGQFPALGEWAALIAASGALLGLGWLVFRAVQPTLLDHV
jgi:ABC-type polysaccharide/polyol phosphate export permease